MYKSPYPYFGGKSRCAPQVWRALGNVTNYVEPFFGSGAVLLARPDAHAHNAQWPTETINDKDGMVSNFWRALQADPDAVAHHADWPVNENDLHARHWWLVNRLPHLTAQLEGDPDYFDAKAAGWWVWGMACWIGSGFCSGKGPWQAVDGRLVRLRSNGRGVNRQLPHLGDNGRGVNRQLPHLGNGRGVNRQLPHLGNGRGVNRKRPHLGGVGNGQGVNSDSASGNLHDYLQSLAERMKRVRVCSGDWTRVMGPSVTHKHGLTGIFLDPPYHQKGRAILYNHDHQDIADEVMHWAIDNGNHPLLRIVYAGYADGTMEVAFAEAGWTMTEWKAHGGFGSQRKQGANDNKHRERLWLSPNCIAPAKNAVQPLNLTPRTLSMFDALENAS